MGLGGPSIPATAPAPTKIPRPTPGTKRPAPTPKKEPVPA